MLKKVKKKVFRQENIEEKVDEVGKKNKKK